MKKWWIFIFLGAVVSLAWLFLPSPDQAQTPGIPKTAHGTGTVVEIDRERGEVTISHGPLPALNMMAMTMSFPVKDRGQLASLQPNQKVEFQLAYDGKDFLITEIK